MARSRELSFRPGEPIDAYSQKLIEDMVAEKMVAQEKTLENSKEFRDIISAIDFEYIHAELLKHITRSGIEAAGANLLGPDRIVMAEKAADEWSRVGEHDAVRNYIRIYFDEFKSTGDTVSPRLSVLRTVIHEMVHAASRTEIHNMLDVTGGELPEGATGYMMYHKKRALFKMLEEGVTELLAKQIFVDYVRTHSDFAPKKETEAYITTGHFNEFLAPYAVSEKFTEFFIQKISLETGVPQKTVTEAVIRGKFEGVDLLGELLKDLEEIFSKKFMNDLAKAQNEKELFEVLYRIKLPKGIVIKWAGEYLVTQLAEIEKYEKP